MSLLAAYRAWRKRRALQRIRDHATALGFRYIEHLTDDELDRGIAHVNRVICGAGASMTDLAAKLEVFGRAGYEINARVPAILPSNSDARKHSV